MRAMHVVAIFFFFFLFFFFFFFLCFMSGCLKTPLRLRGGCGSQLDLGVIAWRLISCPSLLGQEGTCGCGGLTAVRMGMFCRLGWLLGDSRRWWSCWLKSVCNVGTVIWIHKAGRACHTIGCFMCKLHFRGSGAPCTQAALNVVNRIEVFFEARPRRAPASFFLRDFFALTATRVCNRARAVCW